jgi:N-methylhydantoinase B/oxoprolinase/acetone carboxylase alpha subunit
MFESLRRWTEHSNQVAQMTVSGTGLKAVVPETVVLEAVVPESVVPETVVLETLVAEVVVSKAAALGVEEAKALAVSCVLGTNSRSGASRHHSDEQQTSTSGCGSGAMPHAWRATGKSQNARTYSRQAS